MIIFQNKYWLENVYFILLCCFQLLYLAICQPTVSMWLALREVNSYARLRKFATSPLCDTVSTCTVLSVIVAAMWTTLTILGTFVLHECPVCLKEFIV